MMILFNYIIYWRNRFVYHFKCSISLQLLIYIITINTSVNTISIIISIICIICIISKCMTLFYTPRHPFLSQINHRLINTNPIISITILFYFTINQPIYLLPSLLLQNLIPLQPYLNIPTIFPPTIY